MRNGLVSDNIHCICQDSSGYIWIATGEGLSAFNSKTFRNYTTADGLITNNISFVLPDQSIRNKIWIGTNGNGVQVFDDGIFRNLSVKLTGNQVYINTIFQAKDNTIYCGSDEGFFLLKNDLIEIPNYKIKTGAVYSFSEKDTNIWIAAETGLYKISNKTITPIRLPGKPRQEISSLLLDKENNIWAYASNTGFIYKILNSGDIKSYNLKVINFSTGILEDNFKNIWISTDNGLYKFNTSNVENSLTRFTTENGLLQNNVSSILLDRENILWVSTNDNGMSKLVYPDLYEFKNDSKTQGNWSTVSPDNNNHFWASVDNKLIELFKDDHLGWSQFEHKLQGVFKHKNIQKILCDKKGKIYICSASGEIQVYKIIQVKNAASILKKVEIINLANAAKGDKLFTILIDKSGQIWCSILDTGIALLDDNNQNRIKEIYTDRDGIPDNSVRIIYQDAKGNFWFGGYDNGLSEFSNSGGISRDTLILLKHFTTKDGLPNNDIRAIAEKDSQLIIGTRYGGVAVLNSGKFKLISRNDGLFSDAIWSIATTPSKTWVGTQAGIQSLKKNLNISYELSEDIPREPFYSVASSKDGNLCFASATGFYIYEPLKSLNVTYSPPVYLTKFLVNGHERKLGKETSLPSNDNTITFEFQGIINRNESEASYEYRLINKSTSWKLSTNNNAVTYSMLNPGTYTFQVEAVSFDNIKSSTPAQFTFEIDSPFYQQWWFYLLILFSAGLAVFLFIKMRLNRLMEIEKIRTRIASDLHDEIGSGLTHIAMLSEHSMMGVSEGYSPDDSDDNFSTIKTMDKIGRISRNLVDSMIDVIWAIDPKFDSLNDFVLNFKAYAYEICEAKNIELNFETSNIDKIKVTAAVKRSLQLISKEVLNNSLKYSECTKISYNLSVKNKIIYLSVEDNGNGFDVNNATYGNGIINIRKNVKELNGDCEIKSVTNSGTKIYLSFPVNN
jgi:ligand-binding sensor domain-containing protein